METNKEKRILVVDEEIIVRRSVLVVLGVAGFVVEEAADGNEALHKLSTTGGTPFSLVVADASMPDMNLVRFILQIRTSRPQLPILVITGYPDRGFERFLLGKGPGAFIYKPFAPDELIEKVTILVGLE